MDYFFKNKFEENIRQFKAYLAQRDYPKKVFDNPLPEVKFKLDVNGPSSNREKQAIKSCPLKKHNTIQQLHTLKKSSELVAVSTATIVAKINPQITAVTTIQNGAFTQKYS